MSGFGNISGFNLTDFDTQTNNVADYKTISWDDATWILTSSFIIFTMQSGKDQCLLNLNVPFY